MPVRKNRSILAIILVIVVCINFLRVHSVYADEGTPTEPPAPTQVQEEPTTEPPVESTPEPAEETTPPLDEASTPIPENTEVIILNENGDSVPLATQEAAEIMETTDPMWCPEGVSPGGTGCTTNFASVTDLINDMLVNTANYTQNGVIYFTTNPGSGILDLSPTTLAGDFDTLKNYSLTLQGGWNGSTVSPSLSGQTNFHSNPIVVGSSGNPWIGDVSLINIKFSGVSGGDNALTIYTDNGDITLNNVDVQSQSGGGYTAVLDTNSGDILVENGSSFQSAIVVNRGNGFSANSDTGSITISGTSSENIIFKNFRAPGAPYYNGITLSAPTVSLSYITVSGNDGNGIVISNASLVMLTNITSGPDVNGQGNSRSGVLVNGTGSTIVQVTGGTFADNGRYGIEIYDGTLLILGSPTCPTIGDTINNLGCYNVAPVVMDNTAPTLFLPSDITATTTNPAGVIVNYSASATDNVDPTVSVICTPASGSTFAVGATTVNCSATDTAGNTSLGSFQITVVDTTVVPTPTSPAPASPSSVSGTSISGSPLIIPVTSGKMIDLDCDSVFWAFGVKLSFTSLCDYQATLYNVGINDLPGPLPNGYSLVIGLDLNVLRENQTLEDLPDGSGVQMDFPILDGSRDQFVVLYWNGSEWVEVTQQADNENSDNKFYQITTTDKTGVFILVKK